VSRCEYRLSLFRHGTRDLRWTTTGVATGTNLVAGRHFFEAYLVFARGPWDNGILSHKFMELLYMGIDASCTHMYERGLAIHLRGARSRGASLTEIMDVLRLFGSQGLRSMSDGLAIVHEALPSA
jgi:hypothetical protein